MELTKEFNKEGKTSIRILTSKKCNYSCSYCCNELPGIKDSFIPLAVDDIASAISEYDVVVISGGEPLIEENIEATEALVEMATYLGKTKVIYTNLSVLPNPQLVSQVNGWTAGYHEEETDVFSFASQVLKLLDMGAKSVRVNIEASLEAGIILCALIGEDKVYPYKLDDCDRSDIEDIYIIKEEK